VVQKKKSAQTPAVSPSQGKSRFDTRALWICAALIIINIAVYWPLRQYDFVSFDDPDYVTENPNVAGGLTVHSVQWAFTTGYASNWHPLTWLSHMLDVQLFGLNAGPPHLINILFHIANTILLFGFLYAATGALGRSGFVAGLFAVHPLHVESVAWIAERKDVLSTFFWTLTLWAYLGYVRKPSLRRYAAVALLFGLGLMAKPMLVTLPFVLVLLDIWPLSRSSFQWSAIKRSLFEKLPLIGLAAISSIVTFVVQSHGGAVAAIDAIPIGLRVENAVVAYSAYIVKMFWPAGLAALYPFPQSLPAWKAAGSVLILTAISAFAVRQAKHRAYVPVGWCWYLGTLVPAIGLVQVGSQSMADRYTYVPLIGLFIIAAWGIPDLAGPIRMSSGVLIASALIVLSICIWISRQQVAHWRDSVELWSHALAVTADNYRAHTALGSLLQDRGKLDQAIFQYSESIRIKPDFAEPYNKTGAALADEGRTAEAVPYFVQAIRLKPDFVEAHHNLGNAAAQEGKIDEAIAHYRDALRFQPDFAAAHNGLGSVLDDKGSVDEAIREYAEALRLNPDLAAAHNNLAAALIKKGKMAEAVDHLLEAARLQPHSEDFQYNAAMLLREQGRLAEAREHFTAVLKINPGNEAARGQLEMLDHEMLR